MRKSSILLLTFFIVFNIEAQQIVTVEGEQFNKPDKKDVIFGTLKDAETKEGIIGAIVSIEAQGIATVTDINGDFRVRVPLGDHLLQAQSVGFKTTLYIIRVKGSGQFTLFAQPDTQELDAVVVSGEKVDANIKSTDVGKNSLSIESIKQLPMAMGEIDIIKSLTYLPGVSTSSELSSGFNVRGGSTDQNLVLLGDVPIYNPSHLFGFYTAFNAEVIDDVVLYKGAIPASYGGRASSVLHVKYRDGDYERWKLKADLGVVSSKLTVEGPIINRKLSVLASARKSYVNWMLNAFNNPDVSESSADFYDLNAIVNFRLNDRNKFTYSLYNSSDNFNFVGDTAYHWSNLYHSFNWNHSFSDRLNSDASFAVSEYTNQIKNTSEINSYNLNAQIKNIIGKIDFEFLVTDDLSAVAGVNFLRTELNPGEFIPKEPEQNSLPYRKIQNEQGRENAAYFDVNYDINQAISVSAGIRYSRYSYLGGHTVFQYRPYAPLTEESITDSINYSDGDVIQSYSGWEPRLSARVSLSKSTSLKIAFNRMYQYIHLISNTTTIAPNDIWKLSDNHLKPQIADQASLGFYKNLKNNSIETSVEGFYKTISNLIDYKDGADLFLNNHIETELLDGLGKSYGLELYLRKKSGGRFTGWISYTYSRSLRKVEGAYQDIETINGGDWYPASYDRIHNFTNVLIYQLPRKWELSTTLSFKSGQPFTKPIGKFIYAGQTLPVYKDRNNERGPLYHRLDVSLTRNFTFLKRYAGKFNFSVYNLYGRKNPFSIYFQDAEGSPPQPYQLSVLGVPFPSVSVTFNF